MAGGVGHCAHNALKTGRKSNSESACCQAPRVSNRPQWNACDKGSCIVEPDEVESLTSGSEPGVKEGIPLPTVTSRSGYREP
jgi:hypothetical protein